MKHVLNSNQGTMSAVIVRMDGSKNCKNLCPDPYTTELPVE